MLRVTVRFPLGVYHARAGTDEDRAEWPPSPVRLVGALLAAAHGRHGVDPAEDRALIQLLCEAPAPLVVAPDSVRIGEPVEADEAVRLRGVTRWAPRNYVTGPLSPRNLGRDRAAVSKAGVAIGDRPIAFVWPGVELGAGELARLAALASDVSFVGTTRSPVLVEVDGTPGDTSETIAWMPSAPAAEGGVDATVRVPDAATIATFDRRHDARRSARDRVERGGFVPELAIGTPMPYVSPSRSRAAARALDPRWWGEMIVLAIDRDRSEIVPKAAAAYLLARAMRVALLGAFGEPGTPEEAPAILRARDADPHCAIVPLPNVGRDHADGRLLGVALLLPHESRAPDVHVQRMRVEAGLRELLDARPGELPRHVAIPGAGRIWLKRPEPGPTGARLVSLREEPYRGPAETWATVTPIVHSRWRKGGVEALLSQVAADCGHVGLPAPAEIEVLRGAGRRGGADRIVPAAQVPERWRGLLNGPTSHLRITFPRPVRGPVLIGRARHFGLGLCLPERDGRDEGAA